MQYDHLLISYDEIALKGNNKKQFILKLQENIQRKLHAFPQAKVKRTQGRMLILLNGYEPEPIIQVVKSVFGIHSIRLAIKVENDETAIKEAALYALSSSNNVHSFKVSVRRVDKSFPIQSQEMNRILGAHLLTNTDGYKVDVHDPDLHIRVEIRHEATYITANPVQGLGGLPVGTSGKSLLLLSGGIDSPVAGYLAMKRGVAIEAIHFHSPPFTSERAKQKVMDLAEKLTQYGNSIRIHFVPFTQLQQHIFKQIPNAYAMTVMRRIMLKISEEICEHNQILSITTGESLGQVASQTMKSMHVINQVTNYPILRPLVSMDKQEIVALSKKIDTYDISIRPYEDCCTIFVPKSPKTKPNKEKVEYFESQVDFAPFIEEAIQNIEVIKITEQSTTKNKFQDLF